MIVSDMFLTSAITGGAVLIEIGISSHSSDLNQPFRRHRDVCRA